MKELLYQEADNSLRMEPLLEQRNSNHAVTTSSSASASAATAASTSAIMAASATTSTQMRATLIYLAPFLHPCKNVVVPGTQQQQQHHQQQTTSSTALAITPSSSSMLSPPYSPSLGYERRDPDLNVGETLEKTHVALDTSSLSCTTSSSTSGNSGSASASGNGSCGPASTTGSLRRGRVGTSNRNVMPSSTTLAGNSSRNNHNNNAINCNSTTTNVSYDASRCRRHCSCCRNSLDGHDDDGGGGSESTSMSTTTSSSCCHNNKNAAQHTKDNTQDKYYENYEMPALETTTSKTTTITAPMRTLYPGSNNNVIGQQTQDDEQENMSEGLPVVVVDLKVENLSVSETKTDNPSLCLNTAKALTQSLCLKTHMMSFSNFNSTPNSSSSSSTFVNYTNNNRSTKYLRERERERGRRNTTISQQQHQPQESQDHKYDVQQQQTRQRAYESSPTEGAQRQQQEQQQPLKEFMQQRTTKSCGRGRPCGPLCGHYATGDTNIDKHHYQHQHQHHQEKQHHQQQLHHPNHMTMKCYINNNNQMANTSLLSRCHCINNMLSNAPDKQDNPKDNKSIKAGHPQAAQDNGHHNLILRNSSNNCTGIGAENEYEIYSINATTTTSTPTSTPPNRAVLQSPSSSSPLTSTSLYPTSTSYTTILNKECRCFTTNKRDIIGSEIQDIDAFSQDPPISYTASSPTSSTTSTSMASGLTAASPYNNDDDSSYCLIRRSPSWPSSSLIPSSPSPTTASPPSLAPGWLPWLVVSLFGCSNKLTKAVTVSKWLYMWLLFIVLSSSAQCWAGRNDVPTNCTFPVRWEGSWFLSGYQQSIHIKGSQFSYRGRCAASDGNKYLIVDEKGCHRCLVIYEKHKNVLQYKESECEGDSMYMHQTNPSAMAMRSVLNQKPIGGNGGDHRGGAHPNLNGHSRLSSSDQYIMRSNDDMNDCPPDFCKGRETLQNLCDQIPGDALLYSLFRESAEPVKCPLKGPFIFTYNRGNGECKSPVSNIESCTEDSRLLLSFQACPDVVGTESTVEELTCLATWKDGNSRYLVGLVSHHHAISNEERYRCFVYERTSALMDMGHFAGPSMSTSKDAEYKLAQSGDATCNGLDSAEVGSRIMSLRKPPVTERCDFPAWFKGPRHWHVLMGNAVYNYHTNDGSIHIIKPNGYMDTRALCEQINKQTATEMMSVVHYTTGCQSGFMCMVFYRRDTHIIEIQTGKPASRLEDACAADHFDINKTPYITLLASNPDPQICPLEGLYTLRGAIGPPYMATRHKRNHNNKVHGIHNHHHQYESNERGYLHRRHSSLSFRNSANPNEKNAWHSNTRGLPIRSRRDASSTTTKPTDLLQTNKTQQVQIVASSPSPSVHKDTSQQEILVVGNNTNVGFVQDADDDSDTRLRSRRNVPECITNYKAQRQLWIGCTEANVIDVRPLCNDEGDEEYSCHGSWSENGTVYIIARHKGTKHGVCISYRPTEGTNAKLVVGDACYRGTQKPPEHHLEANLSVFGKCGETGSTSATIPILSWLQLMIATLLITFLCQLPIRR